MEAGSDLAIVLRSVPFEERHRIVTALTAHHGQISAIAKNSIQSRRFGGTLEPFTASDWLFTQKPGAELCQLKEATVRESFEGLRHSFEKLTLASLLSEIMLKVAPKNDPCEGLFRLHSNALSALNESTDTGTEIAFLNAYLAKALQWSGNQPRLNNCLQCPISLDEMSPQAELSCSGMDAGWFCPKCRHEKTRHIRENDGRTLQHSLLRLSPVAFQDLRLSLCIPIRQIPLKIQGSKQDHLDLFKFMEALYIYHMPGFDKYPLKSLRFLGLESHIQ